jgi:hypothetical protein
MARQFGKLGIRSRLTADAPAIPPNKVTARKDHTIQLLKRAGRGANFAAIEAAEDGSFSV